MDINQILNRISGETFLKIGIKLFGIPLSLFYLLFSLVMMKQIQVMKKTIEIKDNSLLLFFAFVQLILGSIVVFYSVFIL